MAATTTPLTAEQFLELDLPEDQKHELIGGEILSVSRAKLPHEHVKSNALEVLTEYNLATKAGKVYGECAYQLNEENCLIPNVSLVMRDRIPSPVPDEIATFAPALAVEVVSSESAERLEEKIHIYLGTGSRAVLVLYPVQRTVMLRGPGNAVRIFKGEDRVEIDWLPGLSVPASRFFEGL
jgi:Uma2 family endonuclease